MLFSPIELIAHAAEVPSQVRSQLPSLTLRPQHTYIYIYIYIHTYTQYTYIYIYIIYVYRERDIHVYINIYIRIHTINIYIYIYIYTYILSIPCGRSRVLPLLRPDPPQAAVRKVLHLHAQSLGGTTCLTPLV